jgi:ECF transporter S component (folate family)
VLPERGVVGQTKSLLGLRCKVRIPLLHNGDSTLFMRLRQNYEKELISVQNLITSFKVSLQNCRKVRVLTAAAMLIALTVVLSFFTLYITQSARFSFSFVPMAAGGMLFGPVVSGIIGALADIIGYIIKPAGPYMPLFTLNAVLTGLIYGIFLFKKEPSLKNIIIAQLLITIVVDVVLNSCWLVLLYGQGFAAILPLRILKCTLFFPVQVLILYIMAKYIPVIKKRFHY